MYSFYGNLIKNIRSIIGDRLWGTFT